MASHVSQREFVELSLGKKILFSFCVFAVVLVLAELGLRVVWERPPGFLGERLRETALFVPDSAVGWRMRPNQTIEFTWHWGRTTTITTNSAGYRERERAEEPQAGKRRIMILGDSQAFGYGVSDHELLSERLRERLPDVEVLNLAVTGYNLAQSRAVLETEGRRYFPDLVVLTFVQNDVTHQAIPDVVSHARRVAPGGFKAFLNEHFDLYNFVRTKVNSNKSLARFFVRLGIKRPFAGYEHLDMNLRPFLKEYPESLSRQWTETMREIERLYSVSRDIDASFMVLIVPAKESVQRDALVRTLASVDYAPEDFDLDKPYRKLAAFCARVRITCVDPTDRFREENDAANSPYLEYDLHINAHGHEILAEVLAEATSAGAALTS